MANPNSNSKLPNMMPKNSVAKCDRLRINTRRRNRVTNRSFSGSCMFERFERRTISRRRNCSGVAFMRRTSPTKVMSSSNTSGTTVVMTNTRVFHVVWYGGKPYEL